MEQPADALPNLIRRLELEAGTSNDLLSDRDSRIVRQLLSETSAKLDDLDRDILVDRSPSQHLLEQRSLLYERIERFRIALAPHKSIPPELWNYVFLLASGRGVTLPLRRYRSSVPWSVSYVCSTWRQIALAEPRLWDTINIDYSLTSNYSRLNSIANNVISRSGECGISLASTEFTSMFEDSIFSLAAQREHTHRIHHLNISTTRDALVQYLESPPLQLVSLESMTLSILGHYHFNDLLTHNPMTLFSDAQSLRKITLIAFLQYRLLPELLIVPWGHITDLVLRQVVIPHDMTLTMLRQCTNLVNCTLTLGDLSDTVLLNPPDNDHPVTTLHLRSLTLQVDLTELAIHLFGSISLPSLRALDIGPNPRGAISQALPQDALLSMIKRSGCMLGAFTCRYRNEFDLHPLLQEMRELHNLTLTAHHVGASVFEAMSRGELLPKLELIHCELESIHPFLDFLEYSWSGVGHSANNTYNGLTFVNVWGYNLTDRMGAEERIEALKPQFEKRGRIVSVDIGIESDLET